MYIVRRGYDYGIQSIHCQQLTVVCENRDINIMSLGEQLRCAFPDLSKSHNLHMRVRLADARMCICPHSGTNNANTSSHVLASWCLVFTEDSHSNSHPFKIFSIQDPSFPSELKHTDLRCFITNSIPTRIPISN